MRSVTSYASLHIQRGWESLLSDAVVAFLGDLDNIMGCGCALAPVECLVAPSNLVVSDMAACPLLIHLRTHVRFCQWHSLPCREVF